MDPKQFGLHIRRTPRNRTPTCRNSQMGWRYILAAPYLAAVAGVNLAGRCSDAAISRGTRTRHVRKQVQLLATIGTSAEPQCM